jgi:hypothetical protein
MSTLTPRLKTQPMPDPCDGLAGRSIVGRIAGHIVGRTMLACALCCGLMPAVAAPLLRCQIDQGGSTRMLEFAPVKDPYLVKALDINGRFRFKAVVIGDAHHVEYIKLYSYSQTRRQPVLLHVAKYMAPVALPQAPFDALTGQQYLYSPQREREMQYGCALIEAAP